MSWRVAPSLLKLLSQVNEKYPARRKDSDGTIGDEAHSSRTSDHNPDTDDVVRGMDITHDPASGCDSYALAEALLASRDPRISYVISNRKIANSSPVGGTAAWRWRRYHGVNPHDHHVHVSVLGKPWRDQQQPWDLREWDAEKAKAPAKIVAIPPTLRRGASGADVAEMQRLLAARGEPIKADGAFGPVTFAAVVAFQRAMGLASDGVVGPQTWRALKG